MASKTEIANRALRKLGADRVSNIETENSETARMLNDIFQSVVDEVLAKHPWNCALVRTTLASGGTPAWGYQRQFQLPSDPFALRVWRLDPDHHGSNPQFRVIGRKIHSDEASPLYVELICRVTDTEQLPPYVAVAIAAQLAADTAYRITNSREKEKQMEDWAKEKLAEARSLDAQEGAPEEPITDEFLGARA